MTSPIRPGRPRGALLAEALCGHADVSGLGRLTATGVTLDSRTVEPGWLYAALPGTRTHGASFAASAADRGACAILTDAEGAALAGEPGVPVVVAADVREAMAVASCRVFGDPASRLTMLGITGTNGKTTTAFLAASALADRRVGTIGTIGFQLDGREIPTSRTTVTTPESPDLQALLAVMADSGAGAVALEVSSHALELRRVAGIQFDLAAFVNLGRDHLDFHATMEDYFEAKARLFRPEAAKHAIINIGDRAGERLAERVRRQGLGLTTVGGPQADYQISDFRQVTALRSVSTLRTPTGNHTLELGLPGAYNALNAMIAFAAAELAGTPPEQALAGLAVASIPGRMQEVPLAGPAPLAVVDFAHTPQAVAAALQTFAGSPGRLIAVLGAGGDRDREKRPKMGAAAAAHADLVVVTDDNPRSEDPAAIRADVLGGIADRAKAVEVAGRAGAIREALRLAGPGDVVAVLGKGHEGGQIIGDRVLQFEDATVLREEWARLRKES
ncbi:MAG: UDP-N-acetylmuramoyl-L-alanyl-D-glutamate--2,6-diaminopimelate ligase [Propionibacteriaceae bacterium]|nr:UDP-N-acetylmuramoyl-L-alanyl-D-glutamate--2,6-diaminopimelate ligase [Propionibacteriaceae bacterium]